MSDELLPPQPSVDALRRAARPLLGRTALVTGASRRAGIGYAVARRLAAYGASVYLHHHTPHDAAQPWGADPEGPGALADGLRELLAPGAVVAYGPADLSDARAPALLVEAAAGALGGRLDILVANHAVNGSDQPLDAVDADVLDAHWAVDTRSVILLVQAYARLRAAGRGGEGRDTGAGALDGAGAGAAGAIGAVGTVGATDGRIVMMTSGQDMAGGMPQEFAYALVKGALASVTRTLAVALADLGVTVNSVNPGPVDTGYALGEAHAAVARRFPSGRWGAPDDPARLIAWLATDEAVWITGEVINSEGGFRR